MRLPKRYLNLNLVHEPYRVKVDETGKPVVWNSSFHFVPHGFLDTELFALGNGDTCGFYWPVGKEAEEPILGEIYHDSFTIIPTASNLEGLARIKALTDRDMDGIARDIASNLGFDLPEKHPEPDVPPETLLQQDANAPASLVIAAQVALRNNDFDLAEQYLVHALKVLPEYTFAHYLLASLYRRKITRKLEAASEMLEVVISPMVFAYRTNRKQVLNWLQRLRDDNYPELVDNPIWVNRHKLRFEMYVKRNNDFDIYEEAIEEYLTKNHGKKAVRLRMLVGELMNIETQAFRDRYKYSDEKHNELLANNLKRAGLEIRIPSIRA